MFLRSQELACEPLPSDEVEELKQATMGLLELGLRSWAGLTRWKLNRAKNATTSAFTVSYRDREQSAKVFVNRELAEKFAARQSESPVVKSAQIMLD